MTFLNPGFLWFLFLGLIPVIIHLLNLRPFKTVIFSNLRFIRKIESQSRTRRKLKEYIILLLRVLAIVALVLAFARPVKKIDVSSLPCQNNVVIYVDNSFSMSVRGTAGINLEMAKKKAYEIVQAYGPNARFIILTNDLSPSQFQSYQADRARNIIATIQVTSQIRRLSQIIIKIENILSESGKCRHFVYFISDFQKATTDLDRINFPSTWEVYFVPLQSFSKDNVAIDSVFFVRPYHSLGGKDSLVVAVKNYGSEKIDNTRLELWINDSLRGFQNISLPAHSTQAAGFTFVDEKKGWNSAYVKIDDHLLRFDNKLYFSFYVKDLYRVLLIGQDINKNLRDLYSYKIFTSKISSPYSVGPEEIKNYDVVVVDRLKELSSGMINYLKQFVQSGGALVILPDVNDFSSMNMLLTSLGLSPYQGVDTAQTRVWDIDLHSQLYKDAVMEYEHNELLPKVKKYLRRQVNYASERPVLTANNGATLLSVANIAKGRVYVFSFPMDRTLTDFMGNPLFVVTFVNIGLQTNGQDKLYYVIGQDKWIETRANESEFFKLTNGSLSFMPPCRFVGNTLRISLISADLKSGNYRLLDQNDSLVSLVSLDYSRSESNLDFYVSQQIIKIFRHRGIKNISVIKNALTDITPIISKEIHVQSRWKIFVVLAILFLILEVLVSRLIK